MRMPTTTSDVIGYPLMWPATQARTPAANRKSLRWRVSTSMAFNDLRNEAISAGIHDYAISTGRAPGQKSFTDVGVAFWFMQRVGDGRAMSCYACDAFRDGPQNIKAIAMTIQRLRLIEEYGCYTTEQAMRGAAYDALPPPERPLRPWWEVMSLSPDAPMAVIKAVHRELAKQRHPDKPGGCAEAMRELQRAMEEAERDRA